MTGVAITGVAITGGL